MVESVDNVTAWTCARALKEELAKLFLWLCQIDAPEESLDPWDRPEEVQLRLRSSTVKTDAILQGENFCRMASEARDIFGQGSPVEICNIAVFCVRREVDTLMLALADNPPHPDWRELQKWFGSDCKELDRAIACLEQTDDVRHELVRRARCSLLGQATGASNVEPSRQAEAEGSKTDKETGTAPTQLKPLGDTTAPGTKRPLSPVKEAKVQKALTLIRERGHVKGVLIASAIEVEEATFLRHYGPLLAERGVRNDKDGDGYYLPEAER